MKKQVATVLKVSAITISILVGLYLIYQIVSIAFVWIMLSNLSKPTKYTTLPEDTPIVCKIIGEQNGETYFFGVTKEGKNGLIPEFEGTSVRYDAKYGCFHTEIIDGNVQSFFNKADLVDEEKNEIEETPLMVEIMERSASMTDHDIFHYSLFDCDGTYFVAMELNVNWVSPVHLYRWEENDLVKVSSWDGIRIKSIAF